MPNAFEEALRRNTIDWSSLSFPSARDTWDKVKEVVEQAALNPVVKPIVALCWAGLRAQAVDKWKVFPSDVVNRLGAVSWFRR